MSNIINISDSPLSGLKRKVEWTDLVISKREKEIRLYTTCRFYEQLSGDTYGNEINTREILPFELILYAKNSNLVNPDNGLLVTPIYSGGTQMWQDVAGNVTESVIGHFDFFMEKMNEEINTNDLIQTTILIEDQLYKSYDK